MDSSPNQIRLIRQSLDVMHRERDKRKAAARARMDVVKQEVLEYRKNRPDPLHLLRQMDSFNDPIIEARNKATEKMFNDSFARVVERGEAALKACIELLEQKQASEAAAAAAESEDAIAQTDDLVLDHVKPAEALEMVTAEAEEDMEA